MASGLVKGEGFAIDASVIEADVSRYRGVAPEEADWSKPERQTRAVREYLESLKDQAQPESKQGARPPRDRL